MKTRVAINGFGRIGRVFFRSVYAHENIEVVAVNDLAPAATLAHLLKYDSVHRQFSEEVSATDKAIVVNGQEIPCFEEKDPAMLPWSSLKVDVVIESTGLFRTADLAGKHLTAGAQKVILSAPPSDGSVKSVVMGINDHILTGEERIISNASCTTNCAAPMVQLIDQHFGIDSAYITTVHSYTSDQRLHDAPHKDLRRARAGAYSIVPTTTGAAKAITKIFPHLEGKMGGCGIRVPVPDGSLTDITYIVRKETTIEEVNTLFREAASTTLKGVLAYNEDPIVSIDIVGNTYSCIFDAQLTSVIGKMVKVVGWYDNEMGYSNRLIDLIEEIS
jgi:glyceraldehyde 3-phosphate dehydrogenase